MPNDSETRGLPPHTKDFGAPGHPKHWCERCRLDALAALEATTLEALAQDNSVLQVDERRRE